MKVWLITQAGCSEGKTWALAAAVKIGNTAAALGILPLPRIPHPSWRSTRYWYWYLGRRGNARQLNARVLWIMFCVRHTSKKKDESI